MSTRGHHGVLFNAGSAPPPTGHPPTSLTGLTFWYDGDNSDQWKGSNTTDGAVTANGDNVARIDSAGSIARSFIRDGGLATAQWPAVGSSNGMHADGSRFQGAPTPLPGNNPSGSVPMSDLITDTDAVVIAAFKVDDCATNQGAAYNNAAILADVIGGYFGLCIYKSAPNVVIQAYNYDVSEDVVTVSETIGGYVVVCLDHSSGSLRIRKNGGSWSTIASGNTGSLTQNALFTRAVGAALDATIVQLCVCNAANSDADLLEVERYFGAKVGVII